VDAGGSSLSMRTAQFNFAMSQFLDSPIIGKGYGSIISIFAVNCRKTIYGAESIWLWLMIERGLLGLFAYLSLFFDIFKIKTSKNRFFYIVFSLAYLGLLTVTTTPGLTIAFFLTLILIVYKSENISERSKKNVPQLVDRR
jgi:O-antigen ligase